MATYWKKHVITVPCQTLSELASGLIARVPCVAPYLDPETIEFTPALHHAFLAMNDADLGTYGPELVTVPGEQIVAGMEFSFTEDTKGVSEIQWTHHANLDAARFYLIITFYTEESS